MTINKAYKFRLYPNKKEITIINSYIGASRFVYNHYLYENKNNKYFSYKDATKDLTKLKNEEVWLKEVDSNLLQNALKDLERAYDKYNKDNSGYPKFKKKGYSGSYRTNAIRSTYKDKEYCNIKLDLKNKVIKLPKIV